MSEIVFVGTSDAFGAGGRRQSAILLRAARGGVLIDCGTTTSTGLNDLGIDRNEIDAIVISHFHGDHYGGIPILLLAALYEDARKNPLRIVGPVGIEQNVRSIAAAMCYAIEDREWSFAIDFQEFHPGQRLEIGPVSVDAFETLHQPHTCPHGLVIDTGAHRVAYSGDTGWFDDLPNHVAGSDLFICECTYLHSDFNYHINHDELVGHKDELEVGRVMLTHLGAEMREKVAQAAFDSAFETADDGLVVSL
jgi:ribonuclease BN (tRNA processing enzyme)